MKSELLKGCDNSLLDVDVQNSIEEAFADPSTFTVEDKPQVESQYCLDCRWRNGCWSG